MDKDEKYCKLNGLEDFICKIEEEELPLMYYELDVEDDEEAVIVTDGVRTIIPKLKLSVRTGDFCRYNTDEEYYMPDFSITLIYDENEKDPAKYLYWEQDSVIIALYNYLHKKNVRMEELEGLECIIDLELQPKE